MKSNISTISTIALIGAAVIVAASCTRQPKPDFSYSPADNPEAGDTIQFTNETENATSYNWDFGDGQISMEENPYVIYQNIGEVTVTLYAANDAGEASANEVLTINEPTGLGFFLYQDDEVTTLPLADIYIYDSEANFNSDNVLRTTQATEDGIGLFLNLEPIKYWVLILKEVPTGVWGAAFDLDALVQNEIVAYDVYCIFIANDELKKRAEKGPMEPFQQGSRITPADLTKAQLQLFRDRM